jgi:hypothetical protein
LGFPITALFAKLKDNYRKPGGGMWKFLEENLNNNVKIDKS